MSSRRDRLKVVTHGSDGQRNLMDLSSTFDGSALCTEVMKLKVHLNEQGKVIAMPVAKAVGAQDSAVGDAEEDKNVSGKGGRKVTSGVPAQGFEPR
jgi:hypothetical protein